ncbi:MAG: RDD family protein, partial [Acidimicrobiales bacterium]
PPPQPPGGYPPPPQQPGGYPPPPQQPGGHQQPYGQQGYQPYAAPAAAGDIVTLPSGQQVKVADIGQRFLARLLDALIVGIPFAILYFIIVAGAIASTETTFNETTGQFESDAGAGFFVVMLASVGIYIVLSVLYEVGLIATRGATLGKQIMGVKVITEDGTDPPGWGPAFMRWLIPSVAAFVCSILTILVYLSVLFDNSGRRQGWHDKVAKTLVTSTK